MRTKRKNGFTMIELITIVGVAVVVIGLLIPAISAVAKRVRLAEEERELKPFETEITLRVIPAVISIKDGTVEKAKEILTVPNIRGFIFVEFHNTIESDEEPDMIVCYISERESLYLYKDSLAATFLDYDLPPWEELKKDYKTNLRKYATGFNQAGVKKYSPKETENP